MSPIAKLSKDFDSSDVEAGQADREALQFTDSATTTTVRSSRSRFIRLVSPEFLWILHEPPRKVRETAYLDGIRGIAALIVYLAHNLLSANHLFTPLEVAWGYEGSNYNLINFPFLRLFFTGSHLAVPIFFVISGYVQARKPIRQIREGQDICGSLASAMFRRPIRLYIPVIGSTFSFMVLWHLLGITPALNHHEPTFLADLKTYVTELWHWTFVLRSKNKGYFADHQKIQEAWFAYNGHTWTIPIELQGSLILFLVLLILSKTTAKKRIGMTSILAIYFLVHASPYMFTFLAGSILADVQTSTNFLTPWPGYWILLALGIYVGTPPAQGLLYMSSEALSRHPGFYYLSRCVPWLYYDAIHFLVSVAAVAIVFAIMALPACQRLFEGRIAQYLGRVSFSLYLVHGPIIETFGRWMYLFVGKLEAIDTWQLPIPCIGPLGFDLPFLVANLVILPVTLYMSEICMRIFDDGSALMARRAYESILSA